MIFEQGKFNQQPVDVFIPDLYYIRTYPNTVTIRVVGILNATLSEKLKLHVDLATVTAGPSKIVQDCPHSKFADNRYSSCSTLAKITSY